MKRIVLKIGDVFSCDVTDGKRRFIQYIANDETQLNSSVIRGFRSVYRQDESADLSQIVNNECDFYCHCFLRNVVKALGWQKVGNIADVGKTDLLFRVSADSGARPGEQVAVSSRWYVWRINEPMQYVGKLAGKHRNAEIGIVFSPASIQDKLQTGSYNTLYPGFE